MKLESYLEEKIMPLNYQEHTKSYILSVFLSFSKSNHNYINDSIVLKFFNEEFSFNKFQTIGDHLLFALGAFPKKHKQYRKIYVDIGKASYNHCYNLLRKEWELYSDLSSNFDSIVSDINSVKIL